MADTEEGLLLQSAVDGNLQAVIKSLQNGASIEQKDQNGQTVLMIAAERGHHEIVQELLNRKADVDAKDEDGWTALIAACKEGHANIVALLLEQEANVGTADLGGWTPLVWASYKGHFDTVHQLLKYNANPNERGQHNMTALIWAAGRGHWKVVKQLIIAGAQADVTDKYGTSALVWACRKGHCDVVRILLAEGANIQAAGTHGWTPLIMATKGGYQDVVELLLEHQANANAIDQDGRSALSWAAKEGHASIVRVLLNQSVYINMPDKLGDTALMIAAKEGHVAVVEIMIEKFADLEYADLDGKTPLYFAVEKGHVEVVRELLNAGADPQVTNKDGETPLLRGAKKKHTHCVQLLLEKGASATATDKKGDTALHIAVRNRFAGLCEVLLHDPKNNRLLYKPNKAGETPYSIDCSLKQSVITPLFGNKSLNPDPTKMDLPDAQESFIGALADFISEPSLSLPLTVGLYTKWGAGKSLFLQKLQEHLLEFQHQVSATPFHISASVFLFATTLSLTIGFITWAASALLDGIIAGAVLFLFLLSVFLLARSTSRSPERSIHRFGMRLTKSLRRFSIFIRLVYCVAPSTESVRQMLPVHYITIDMSRVTVMADTPMQSLLNLTKELSDLTEANIGILFPRLFRVFKAGPYRSKNTSEMDLRPRWKSTCCCIPTIVLSVVFFLVLWSGLTCFAIYGTRGNKIATGIEIASSCIVGGAILISIPRWFVVIYCIILSLKKRVSIVASQSGIREDTFLNVLKQEIDLYVEMLECFDGFSRQQTRVVVALDLLDSLEQQKVLQLVNSLNLLLADTGHPFVAVFTLDPRLLVKAVDQSLANLPESHLTAYDYLRNLVDLPCYVPEQSKTPATGLVPPSILSQLNDMPSNDHDDVDLEWDGELTDFSHNGRDFDECNGKAPLLGPSLLRNDSRSVRFSNESLGRTRDGRSTGETHGTQHADDKCGRFSSDLSQFMRDNEGGTLSDIRRTMNIVSLMARLLRARGIYFRWRALASWVSLADGWPYKITWLSLLSEDSSLAAPPNLSIKRLYNFAGSTMPVVGDPEIGADNELVYFETYIANHQPMLTVKDLRIFASCTFHVDPTIRKMMVEYLQAVKSGTLTKQGSVNQQPTPTSPQSNSLQWTPTHEVQLPLLSQLGVEDICQQLSQLEGIQADDVPQYEARMKEANVSGKVLSTCDIQELKDALQMKFGDWQMFKGWVLQCRTVEHEMQTRSDLYVSGKQRHLHSQASIDRQTPSKMTAHHAQLSLVGPLHRLDRQGNSADIISKDGIAVVIENQSITARGHSSVNSGSAYSTMTNPTERQRETIVNRTDQWIPSSNSPVVAEDGQCVANPIAGIMEVNHIEMSQGGQRKFNAVDRWHRSADSGFASTDHDTNARLLSRQKSMHESNDPDQLSSISSSQDNVNNISRERSKTVTENRNVASPITGKNSDEYGSDAGMNVCRENVTIENVNNENINETLSECGSTENWTFRSTIRSQTELPSDVIANVDAESAINEQYFTEGRRQPLQVKDQCQHSSHACDTVDNLQRNQQQKQPQKLQKLERDTLEISQKQQQHQYQDQQHLDLKQQQVLQVKQHQQQQQIQMHQELPQGKRHHQLQQVQQMQQPQKHQQKQQQHQQQHQQQQQKQQQKLINQQQHSQTEQQQQKQLILLRQQQQQQQQQDEQQKVDLHLQMLPPKQMDQQLLTPVKLQPQESYLQQQYSPHVQVQQEAPSQQQLYQLQLPRQDVHQQYELHPHQHHILQQQFVDAADGSHEYQGHVDENALQNVAQFSIPPPPPSSQIASPRTPVDTLRNVMAKLVDFEMLDPLSNDETEERLSPSQCLPPPPEDLLSDNDDPTIVLQTDQDHHYDTIRRKPANGFSPIESHSLDKPPDKETIL